VVTGLVKKAGAFFAYGDTKLGQGRENAKDYLRQHPELAAQLEEKIRASKAVPSISLGESSETFPQEA
jgi:recombination protein RecA